MTLSAQIQNALVPIPPPGEGTLHLPSSLFQHDQAILGPGAGEAFAQIFAREFNQPLAAAGEGQPRQSLNQRIPSLAENSGPGNMAETIEHSLVQSHLPPEPAFRHLSEAGKSSDFANEEAVIAIDPFDWSLISHQVAQDELVDTHIDETDQPQSVLGKSLMRAVELRPSIPSQFDVVSMAVSPDIKAELLQGANLQAQLPVQGPSLLPPMSQLSTVIAGNSRVLEPQAAPGTDPIIQSSPGIADESPNGPTPASILPAVPPYDVLLVAAAVPKGSTQIGAVSPVVAAEPFSPVQEVPHPPQLAPMKLAAQDIIIADVPPNPSNSPPDIKTGLHHANSVVLQPLRAEVGATPANLIGLVKDLPAAQQTGQFIVQTTFTRAEVQDRTAATELATFVSVQTLGSGPADIFAPTPDPLRSVLPKATVQQLIEATVRTTDRPVELVLTPEDLGRVRISMSISDASVTMYVLAERSETLELIRRHSELLAQELRNLGYGMITFSFGQHGHGQDGHAEKSPAHSFIAEDEPLASTVINATPGLLQTGLDIRL